MICVIDACSYIYLNQYSFTIAGKDYTLFTLLNQLITIRQSEIVGQEILKHFDKVKAPENDIERNSRTHKFKRSLAEYDNLLFDGTIGSSSKDAGEKANIAVCIDIFNYKNNSQIVFLSDDLKALKSEDKLQVIYNTFPYFPLWTSFEVILFIYYAYNRQGFTYDLAKQTLQDLIAFHSNIKYKGLKTQKDRQDIDNDQFSKNIEKLQEWQQKTKQMYSERLKVIEQVNS